MVQPQIRPVRILLATAGIVGGLVLLVWAIDAGLHRYRVHQAGGDWCVVFSPDGGHETLYGAKACGY